MNASIKAGAERPATHQGPALAAPRRCAGRAGAVIGGSPGADWQLPELHLTTAAHPHSCHVRYIILFRKKDSFDSNQEPFLGSKWMTSTFLCLNAWLVWPHLRVSGMRHCILGKRAAEVKYMMHWMLRSFHCCRLIKDAALVPEGILRSRQQMLAFGRYHLDSPGLYFFIDRQPAGIIRRLETLLHSRYTSDLGHLWMWAQACCIPADCLHPLQVHHWLRLSLKRYGTHAFNMLRQVNMLLCW